MVQEEVILLAEDSGEEIVLIENAIKRVDAGYRVFGVMDAQQALNYLTGAGPYRDRKRFPLPRLILLDLEMPNLDGFEFLRWLGRHMEFRYTPVVVLTKSSSSPEVKRAYELGADSFILKPVDTEELFKELKAALEYWAPIGGPAKAATARERQQDYRDVA